MIRKRLLSACLALALCLGLLPATALAAVPSGQAIYVGEENVTSGGYWTTDDSGNVAAYSGTGTPTDNYIHYDAADNTLTLHNATIRECVPSDTSTYVMGAGIGVFNQNDASKLTIKLEGSNAIENVSTGICVLAFSYSTGDASLTITGSGSLDTSGRNNPAIRVQSNGGNATLSIENAKVTATASSSGYGVLVQSKNDSSVSLTVDGGSLTATGSGNDGAGIQLLFGSGDSASGTPTVTVSNNAIMRASGNADGIATNSTAATPSGTGIVFDGGTGTVYGSVTLQEDLEIGEGESLTIPNGTSLTIGNDATLTNEGTVTNSGTLTNNGKIENSGTLPSNIGGTAPPSITTTSLAGGAVGEAYNATLAADGEPASWTWNADANSSLPPGLTLSGNSISGTPTTTGTYNFTVTATNSGGSDSKEFTLTIDQQGTIHVTSVSLDKTSLELTEGETAQLTATVLPDNATNKNVTWSTSDASVAAVENGVVRATGRGTATITVTTEDGGFTAGCTVTVSRYSTGGGPTTYAVTAPDAENGTVRVSPSRASRGTTVTITVTPDEGYELESLTVLDSRDNEIPLTDKGDGKYTFTMPSGRVTVEASFAEIAPEPLPFGDVDDGDWFADAVRFVYENGMMNGVSETDFAPHAATSRSMIVTILYRLEGEPVVDYAMDFTDVAGDAYYAEAVRWAASEGIVGGYGGGLFGSDDAVTREQLAVILYRYAVYKGYDVSIGEDTNILSYADFADLSEYAIPAMQWACGAGIVNGTSESTLTPQGEATRAQVAAMLMRFCEAIG